MPQPVKSALLVALVLLLGLVGLSFAKHLPPGPTADDLLRGERHIPFDHQAADPPQE